MVLDKLLMLFYMLKIHYEQTCDVKTSVKRIVNTCVLKKLNDINYFKTNPNTY